MNTLPDRIRDHLPLITNTLAEGLFLEALLRITDYQMREQIAKEANDKMREELERLKTQHAGLEARSIAIQETLNRAEIVTSTPEEGVRRLAKEARALRGALTHYAHADFLTTEQQQRAEEALRAK